MLMLGSIKSLGGGNARTRASVTVRIYLVLIKPTANNHKRRQPGGGLTVIESEI